MAGRQESGGLPRQPSIVERQRLGMASRLYHKTIQSIACNLVFGIVFCGSCEGHDAPSRVFREYSSLNIEIHFMPDTSLSQLRHHTTIMLSVGFSSLEKHRKLTIAEIVELGGYPIQAEDFIPGEDRFEIVREALKRSDALIWILNAREIQANPSAIDLLEFEFEEANRRGLPVLPFIEGEPRYLRSMPKALQKIGERVLVRFVDDLDEFRQAIRPALDALFQRLAIGDQLRGVSPENFPGTARSDPLQKIAAAQGSAVGVSSAAADSFEDTTLPPSIDPAAETLHAAPFYSDHAARSDLLNRKAVAETVATMIENVWRDDDKQEDIDRTFMVHLHGRWGSGKTSILNFLRGSLVSQKSSGQAHEAVDPSWIVVDYNAWRNQALGPAWWTLMETVYRQARQQLGGWCTESGQRLILRDRLWRIGSSYAPYALIAGLLIALGLLLIFIWRDTIIGAQKSWIDEGVKFIVSVAGLVATVFAFGHSYPVGSARTAKSYLELSRDPLNPLIRRYGDLVGDIGRPVAVFIDDLDRCNAEFVVELLQTVQTLFRNARVLYVVAADRDWVCASYQQIYKTFHESIGEPGKSLGHLFVEKVLQLSVEVPRLGERERNRYWEELIKANLPVEEKVEPDRLDRVTKEIEDAKTESKIIEIVDRYRDDPGVARIVAAKAFRQMQAAPIEKERRHFLNGYASLIEPNPRAMKRLLNAYGFRRGFDIQSRHRSDPDALVRWTILENRWPILADYLEGRAAGNDIIEALMKDKAVLEVANGLTWDKLRPVASAPDEPPKPETTPGAAKK